MKCKKCERIKQVFDEIYGLADEARKALDEGIDRQYVQGIITAIMMKVEREE